MFDPYDALIFDCDGTLVDSLYVHETAWIEVLQRHSIPYTTERMNQLDGALTAATIRILAAEAGMQVDVAAVAAAKEARLQELIFDTLSEIKPMVDIARRYYGVKPLGVATGSATAVAVAMLDALQIT